MGSHFQNQMASVLCAFSPFLDLLLTCSLTLKEASCQLFCGNLVEGTDVSGQPPASTRDLSTAF